MLCVIIVVVPKFYFYLFYQLYTVINCSQPGWLGFENFVISSVLSTLHVLISPFAELHFVVRDCDLQCGQIKILSLLLSRSAPMGFEVVSNEALSFFWKIKVGFAYLLAWFRTTSTSSRVSSVLNKNRPF